MGHRGWNSIRVILDWLADNWDRSAEGIWETRGGRQDFTFGAVDELGGIRPRIRLAAEYGRPAAIDRQPRLPVQPERVARRAARFGRHVLPLLIHVRRCTRSGGPAQRGPARVEKMLTYANHVGLFSEEIALTGEQIGNFPQAFTHLALIDAVITLDEELDRIGGLATGKR
jgi:GH15 family glucan-1,4-alpha-glucosidase